MSGAELIAAERGRQQTQEGWDADHDALHDAGELVNAAIVYADVATYMQVLSITAATARDISRARWPWQKEWLKLSEDPVRNLTKAGALIAAEIDRIQRAKGKGSKFEDFEQCDRCLADVRDCVCRA